MTLHIIQFLLRHYANLNSTFSYVFDIHTCIYIFIFNYSNDFLCKDCSALQDDYTEMHLKLL